jgi:hypothetical protein
MEPLKKVKKTPLIFVPGIMGSSLFKKGTGDRFGLQRDGGIKDVLE